MNSRWSDLFLHLQKNNIEVFSPGVKEDECTSPYVVVLLNGSSKVEGISTQMDLYSLLCYVPKNNYSLLDDFVLNVRKVMQDLKPMFIPTGSQLASFYDDVTKSHMVSLEYKNYKKML